MEKVARNLFLSNFTKLKKLEKIFSHEIDKNGDSYCNFMHLFTMKFLFLKSARHDSQRYLISNGPSISQKTMQLQH